MNGPGVTHPTTERTAIMKNIRFYLLGMFLGMLLTGCATPGPKFSNYLATLSPPPTGQGRIWFYRAPWMANGVNVKVALDNVEVGKSKSGSFFEVTTTPGTHVICVADDRKRELTVPVTTNADTYVQCYVTPGLFSPHIIPTVMNEADALRGLKDLTYAK